FSRKGKARAISYIFILTYYALITQLAWTNGSTVPQALLMYALIVVMSGILVSSFFGFLMTFLIVGTLVLLNYLERHQLLPIEQSWKQQPLFMMDSFVHSITL